MDNIREAAKAAAGRPFGGNTETQVDMSALGGPENRKTGDQPLPILVDLMEMAQRLTAEQARVASGANPCCLAVCSPDPGPGRFVEHSVAEIADRFSRCLRSYDSIYRFGRDRVVICMPHLKKSDAPAVLLRMRNLITKAPFGLPNGASALITVTAGGAMMEPSVPVHETLNRADRAMELSRIGGDNRILMWSHDMF